MRTLLRSLAAPALALAAVIPAANAQQGDVAVSAAWTRAVGTTAPTAAGYMTLRNRGAAPDRLVGAETPAARSVEIHEQRMEEGVMRMRPLPGGVPLPPGETVTLGPGGTHLMLVGPTRALARGEWVPLTLRFERAGEVRVELSVEAAGARQPAHAGH
ncbi:MULTISPECIES: copper chaperone PCu(A)C [Roseomonadaceae]|jgi:copper(I)-binding protein|uniref:Copper chaperone PCu(A)C n=1 Tax=Caldovatus aquaticus TaxID=2865671 RepID=A0ABS7F425_9PROT|nr:copper chaperone PCu(A)C [Caldovatus aquaticus]MBW8270362.1 copper chaperone PCu(A)C [Caldovatus aquaticus]